MPFTDPVTTLPADAITGQITGSQLAADAIDGKTITGALIRTAATGKRIALESSSGEVRIYRADGTTVAAAMTPTGPDGHPGFIAYDDLSGNTYAYLTDGNLYFGTKGVNAFDDTGVFAPTLGPAATLVLSSGRPVGVSGSTTRVLLNGGAGTDRPGFVVTGDNGTIDAEIEGDLTVDDSLTARNIASGSINVVPVADTATSVAVTGLNVAGSLFTCQVTANSTNPVAVQMVSASGVSSGGVTLWINRNSTTSTTLWWLIIGR